jgi:hypothetical protein
MDLAMNQKKKYRKNLKKTPHWKRKKRWRYERWKEEKMEGGEDV